MLVAKLEPLVQIMDSVALEVSNNKMPVGLLVHNNLAAACSGHNLQVRVLRLEVPKPQIPALVVERLAKKHQQPVFSGAHLQVLPKQAEVSLELPGRLALAVHKTPVEACLAATNSSSKSQDSD